MSVQTPRPMGVGSPTSQGLADRLDGLAGACAFLSRLLLSPLDEELRSRIAGPNLMSSWPLLDPDSVRAAADLCRGASDDLAVLLAEFQALFLGPGIVPCSPFESVHRTQERLVFDGPTIEVRRAYAAFGMVAPSLNREPDDHIGLELHFLAELCVRALEALDSADTERARTALEAARRFLEEHLSVWAPDFFAGVRERAGTVFYRGLADAGASAVRQAEIALGG